MLMLDLLCESSDDVLRRKTVDSGTCTRSIRLCRNNEHGVRDTSQLYVRSVNGQECFCTCVNVRPGLYTGGFYDPVLIGHRIQYCASVFFSVLTASFLTFE